MPVSTALGKVRIQPAAVMPEEHIKEVVSRPNGVSPSRRRFGQVVYRWDVDHRIGRERHNVRPLSGPRRRTRDTGPQVKYTAAAVRSSGGLSGGRTGWFCVL